MDTRTCDPIAGETAFPRQGWEICALGARAVSRARQPRTGERLSFETPRRTARMRWPYQSLNERNTLPSGTPVGGQQNLRRPGHRRHTDSTMVAESQNEACHIHRLSLGESPGGVTPPGARRTGREPLDSSGSHRPAVGAHAEAPVREQPRLASEDSGQEPACLGGVAAQPLVLPAGPSNEVFVDPSE